MEGIASVWHEWVGAYKIIKAALKLGARSSTGDLSWIGFGHAHKIVGNVSIA